MKLRIEEGWLEMRHMPVASPVFKCISPRG